MVRETRHLWVGNLPHTIREDRILDHFKRYGKVQSVKILPKKDEEGGGACATVAFIDIKSAAKAHNADNKIDERTLKTDYYEPPASSTASSAIFIHERDDALVVRNTAPPPPPTAYATSRNARYGLPEDRNYERPGHYYERVTDREPYLRRPVGMGYHDEDSYQGRGKSRDRYVRSASGNTYAEGAERNQNHFRAHNTRQIFDQTRFSEQYNDERDVGSTTPRLSRRTNNASTATVVSSVASSPPARSESRPRRSKRRSPSQTPSASRSNSMSRSRSRSSSGSRSSSSSSKLRSSSSDSSGRSWSPSKSRSPVTSYGNQGNAKRLERPASAIANPSTMTSYLSSSISTSAINCTPSLVNSQNCAATHCNNTPTINDSTVEKDEKKPLGICVRNLPVRSTDTSLKDGLFHEYKKHGKVTMVKVIGQGTERYAVVCFKKSEDVEKALEVSKDKQFFGCKIEVTAHEGLDADDNEFRPLEAELDEYHPKATRTLFIGNLEKDITTAELRKHFDQFGEIIEIDIKKQGSATSYAFIQYSDIASVVKAMRKLDGENLGANRVKLGFGKSMPTNCVWLDGIVDTVNEKYLARHFSRFGLVAYCAVDWEKGHALIFYDSVEFAQIAVAEMRGRILGGKKLQVDFASRECQTTFFDKLEMTGQMVPGDRPWERRERRGTEFEIVRADDRDSRVGFDRVYTRYEGQTRTNRGNFRGIQRTGFGGRGRAQNFSNRYEMYYDEFGERRHRYGSRDESGGESSAFDSKIERLKYGEPVDCNNRKRNKLRNSISDQESHHSQSPPRSRHESRSTSPVSKERKSMKDRLHHRIKSPGSHNSSQVSSPCRESTTDDPAEAEYKELKSSDGKVDICDSDISFPATCPKNSLLHDGLEKIHPKIDYDLCRRKSVESETFDENCSTSEQLSQVERKRRLLAAAASLNKDGAIIIPKVSNERFKLKNSISHSTQNKLGQVNCISDSLTDEKSDAESGELHEECGKEKLHSGESANTDLKYLQKKHVQILHLLEQLHEGVNSSDTDGSIDSDRFSRKKKRSLSSCMESVYSESDITKAITKDECNAKLIKSGLKDQISLTKSLNKTDSVDSNNCFSLSLDSFVFRKHLDPRKVDHYTPSSLPKGLRIPIDKEEPLLSNTQAGGESYVCLPSNVASDLPWKEKSSENLLQNCDGDDVSSAVRLKIKEEASDAGVSSKKVFSTSELTKSLTVNTFSDSPVEIKRERDISPLSLPLPKFAASLRSPKSSPSVLTSPKSIIHSPRLVHSPNSHGCIKAVKTPDVLLDVHHDRKIRDICLDEKLNGINISSSASSPSESHLQFEMSDVTCLETIQSPKNNFERSKEITISSDSDLSPISSPNRPSIEDRIKALDERYNAWSGSTRTAGSAAPAVSLTAEVPKSNVKRSRFNVITERSEPSDIVKSLLSKSTILDQDSLRLKLLSEKYEPLDIKTDVSPKVKPAFRTKAAAKEFSPSIAPALQSFNTAVHSNTSSIVVSQGITSSLETSQSAISNDILSPIMPATQHLSQVASQLYTSCVTSFPSIKEAEENAFTSVKNLLVDQACAVTKHSSLILKPDSDLVQSVEVVPHGLLANSLPVSLKKESLNSVNSKDDNRPLSGETEKLSSIKTEAAVALQPSIIPVKDYSTVQTNDQIPYKSMNICDHDHKELTERQHSSFCDNCIQWKEPEDTDEVADVAKALPSTVSSDLKIATPDVKKRVSSIDSNESESWKSYKSLEFNGENHDAALSKHDKEKGETKVLEPECKKSKISLPQNDQNCSPIPVSMPAHKKNEKKEKSCKAEKCRGNSTKKVPVVTVLEKEESDGKSIKNESKDKSKSDNHKVRDDKKNKPREHKENSAKSEQRSKSYEKRNADKDNKTSTSGNSKGKKEHPVSRTEKAKVDKKLSDKKQSSKSKAKLEVEVTVEEEPVYFSMYDKVKARSSKQQTMKHQAKDLETVRQKFSKLKQSRAKKEGKSKSVDSEKDSDSGSQLSSDSDGKASKAKQQRKRKLVIESSSDDEVPQDSQSRNNRSENKDFSENASDSDFEQKVHHKPLTCGRSRKKKTDVIESDSSDSNSQLPVQKSCITGKRKSKSKNIQEKSQKNIKSEGEGSDFELVDKLQMKEKEHKRRKIKRTKNHDNKMESEALTTNYAKKNNEEIKISRKKLHKEEKQYSDSSVATRHEETSREKPDHKDKKTGNDAEPMDVENSEKFKTSTRKKKKSKKTSRSKEKRITSVRRSSEFTSRKDEESESKSSLPVLLSPRPNSPTSDKPLSPPCLRVGDASENDAKSDFSDDEFDIQQIKEPDISISDRNIADVRGENAIDCSSTKSYRKKESILSPSKLHSELFDSDPDHDSITFPEKTNKFLRDKEQQCSKGSSFSTESTRKRILQSSVGKKGRDIITDSFHHKVKYDKSGESCNVGKHSENKLSVVDSYVRDDKRKKKLRKTLKEKRWKSKGEDIKGSSDFNMSVRSMSPFTFESVSLDDSHLSDIRLDEKIASDSMLLEHELLASEETNTFGDDEPPPRKEEKPAERKFDEEAAKETKRLEAELNSRDGGSWHMKDKTFGPELHPDELCSDGIHVGEGSSFVLKGDNIFSTLALHSSSLVDTSHHENDLFISSHSSSDQYKLDDKEVSEIDDQRKIEDDLAVSALLQEMNNSDISAPELTKETDYLEPLINAQPDETMTYLLRDESDNSLHIVDHSSELLVSENGDPRLDSDVIALSPSSNSEPPALEISHFEDSLTLKDYHDDNKLVQDEEVKSENICDSFSDKGVIESVIESRHTGSFESSVISEETTENKPPVIDIPSGTATLEAISESMSPKSGKRLQSKHWPEQSPVLSAKDANLPLVCDVSNKVSNSEELESNPSDFEDITMDTKDNKDDDNPPVLLPVDLQPRVETTSESVEKTEALSPSPDRSHENVNTDAKILPCSLSCSESVIVRAPEVEKLNDSFISKPKTEQNVTLSLADFDDSSNDLVPLSISTYSHDHSEASVFKLSDVSKNSNEGDGALESHINFESNTSLISESTSWRNSEMELATLNATDTQKIHTQDHSLTRSPILYYPDIFQQTDTDSIDKYEVKKCDTSVIKSTTSIAVNSLTTEPSKKNVLVNESSDSTVVPSDHFPTETSSKNVPVNESSDSRVVPSDHFLHSVFSPNKDNRGVVIFNTSQLTKEKNNPGIQHIFGYDQKYSESSNVDKSPSKNDKSPEKPAVNNSTVVLNKDPFDALHETSKPLHFPPLFTIPTTEALLSPCSDKPSSVTEENASPYNCAESGQDQKTENAASTASVDDDISSKSPSSKESEKLVSLSETLSKMEEKLEDENSAEKKSRAADVESVSSDTTDIAFPDIKAELEMSQLTSSEEPVQEEPCAVEEKKVIEKPKSERPRRGRRPKPRKFTESSKPEAYSEVVSSPAITKGRRVRPTSYERSRRSLRSDTVEQSSVECKDTHTENRNDTLAVSESEDTIRKAVCEEMSTADSASCKNLVLSSGNDSTPIPYTDTFDSRSVDKVYNTRAEETKRRRGRKKKSSGEHQSLSIPEKADVKNEKADHSKDFHRPKESRLWLSQSSEKEQRASSAGDIYEFRETDEEESIQYSVKERLHSKSAGSNQDPKPDSKLVDIHSEKEKSDVSKPKVQINDDGESTAKEYVTEINQHGKKITIRFQKKDGPDGNSSGSTETVKTSEALGLEEMKSDVIKIEKEKDISKKESASLDSSYSGPSKSTRKSTRIMNQTARSTMDEVIEEVVKGNFKISSSCPTEPTPSRVTRRSRANRKSEEIVINVPSDASEDKNKNEPMFAILDNTVKDVPESKKTLIHQTVDTPSVSEANNTSEPERNDRIISLRSFRLNHSTANKLDAQKESSVSEIAHDSVSRKKENVLPSEEKKDSSNISQQSKKECSASLTNMVRTSLPVLKVELPRVVLSSGKESVSSEAEKGDENEDDSDSRSSPVDLVDPQTGFLTPVRKKDESVAEKVESAITLSSSVEAKVSSNHSTTFVSSVPAVAVASYKIDIKEKKLKDEGMQNKTTPWDQSNAGSQVLSLSALSSHVGTGAEISATRKEPAAGHAITDIQISAPPDPLTHFKDLKFANNNSKTYGHIGMLTPGIVSTSCTIGGSSSDVKNISSNISCQSLCASASSLNQPSVCTAVNSYTMRMSTGATSQGVVSTSGTTSVAFSTISPSASTHQPPLRTVVTAVVTVASSESTTVAPFKVQAKCLPSSSAGLPLSLSTNSRNAVSPLHKNITSLPASNMGLTPCTKGNSSDSLSSSQHWRSSGTKEVSLASAVATTVNNNNWSNSNLANQISLASEISAHLSAVQSNACHQATAVGKAGHPHSSKGSAAYLQQAGFATSMYEAAQCGLQNMAVNSSGGVIAELLQNPQLLQQHKDLFAATASSAGRFQDRNQSQIVRPSTPVTGILPDVAARLGNPTPPHTPTPLVSTPTHCLQQSPDIRNAHVPTGLHLLQSAPYTALGIPSVETNAYVHSQIMFAAAHPHYPVASDLRAQQEVRAPMSISPRFAYPPIPSTAVSSGSFRQPFDSRFAHSYIVDHKADVKTAGDLSDFANERRTPDEKGLLSIKLVRSKKEDKELKMGYSEEHERPGSGHDKHPSITNTQSVHLRHDQFHHVKHFNTDRDLNPPVAHQSHVSTVPYSLDAHSSGRQQLLVGPQVGSPSRIHADCRSSAQPAHTTSTYCASSKRDLNISQGMPSNDKQACEDIPKEVSERTLSHQVASVAGGERAQNMQSNNVHPLDQSAYAMISQNKPLNERINANSTPIGSDIANVPCSAHDSEITSCDAFIVSNHPVMWQGLLELKNDNSAVQMHYVAGSAEIARDSLKQSSVKISQRMKLGEPQLEGVKRKLQNWQEHCVLVALPCGRNEGDVLTQSNKLKNGFIKYLILKEAAGIVNIGAHDAQQPQPTYVIHIFNPNKFTTDILKKFAEKLADLIQDITYLVVIITTA